MAFVNITTRTTTDPNASADINTLQTNINFIALRQYVEGNTYNTVNILVTGSNWTTTRGVFVPYNTLETSLTGDSAFRLRFDIRGTISVTASTLTLTIVGVTFKNIAGFDQAVAVSNASTLGAEGRALTNTATIKMDRAANATDWSVSGDVELDSKPTWMD